MLLSLAALGVGSGDEVICPSLTWCSTANVALHRGARVVFCDIDPESLCAGADQILPLLTQRTRAVMPVHFGGRAVDIPALRAALPDSVAIVEDAAHAFGARMPDGRMVGASGQPTCFSFYANKVISTADGGAIALPDGPLAEQLRSLRMHGLAKDAWQRRSSPRDALAASPLEVLGFKANYTDLQAAIGRVQLARQGEFAATRARIAEVYCQGLVGFDLALQDGVGSADHARHLFLVLLPESLADRRAGILTGLRERGIGATVHYPPLHQMPLYNRDRPAPPLVVTEQIGRRVMTLPIGASMTADDAHRVVDTLLELIA
jgi:dTDP-4-amino-4,6-dideoxygalactose transaminase